MENKELKTVRQLLDDTEFVKGMRKEYTPFEEYQTRLFIMFTMEDKKKPEERKFINDFINSDDYNGQFITKVLKKRIEAFKLEDKINDEVLAMWICFGISSPGAAIIYLIDLLEFYETHHRKADISDISNIYPFGFYDENTLLFIIDNIMKPNRSIFSKIY